MSMTFAIYSIAWSIIISNCVIIFVLTLQINLVHQITLCKCEKWGHLSEVGFKSRRSNILIMKFCAFITVCFWKCWGLSFWCVGWFIWKHGKSVMVNGRFPYGWHHPYGWVWSPNSDNDVFMDTGNLLAWENLFLSEPIILVVTTWTMTVLKQMLAISVFLNVRFKDSTCVLGTS